MRATMERRIGAACGRGICCPTSEGGECFPVDSGPTRGAALPSTKGGGPVIYTIGSVIYADGYLTGTDDIPHADGWRRDLQLPKATTSREAVAARSATAGTSPPTSRQAGLRFFVPQSVQLESAAPAMGCSFSGLNALYDTVGGSGGDVWVKDYRFRLLRRLGDAGPVGSSVFLVKEVVAAADTTGVGPGAAGLARKKGVDPSHISADGTYALKKVLIQSNQHLELVRQEIQVSSQFSHPNLLPLVEHAIIAVKGMQNGSQNHEAYLLFPDHLDGTLQDVTKIMLEKKEYLPTINVLQIFRQLCAGLKHMHSFDPPYAHNGVKPDNVLITQRREQPLLAILMDFESARPARITIRSQAEALKLQEWASEHCSAYYRAPELWECPSHADIDERTDIWSLGCTLYAMMYRKSPFDYEIDESAGESLHAAVRSAHIKWPTEAGFSYPDSLRQFITWMLQPQPAVRPHIDDIIIHVDKLIAKYST